MPTPQDRINAKVRQVRSEYIIASAMEDEMENACDCCELLSTAIDQGNCVLSACYPNPKYKENWGAKFDRKEALAAKVERLVPGNVSRKVALAARVENTARKQDLALRVSAATGKKPNFNGLIASGVNVLFFEDMDAQYDTLVAAAKVRKGPGAVTQAKKADAVTPGFTEALSTWLAGDDRSYISWNRFLKQELGASFTATLSGATSDQLRRRGITPAGEKEASKSVALAIKRSNDIRKRLLNPDKTEALSSEAHLNDTVRSLLKASSDLYEDKSVAGSGKFVAKRWRAPSGKSSRHAHLDGVEKPINGTFSLGGGVKWSRPRADPAMVKHSSNCTCYIEYQDATGKWV